MQDYRKTLARYIANTPRNGRSVFVSEHLLQCVCLAVENMEKLLNDLTTMSLSTGTQLAFMDGHDTPQRPKTVVVPVTSFETLGDLVTYTLETLQRIQSSTLQDTLPKR